MNETEEQRGTTFDTAKNHLLLETLQKAATLTSDPDIQDELARMEERLRDPAYKMYTQLRNVIHGLDDVLYYHTIKLSEGPPGNVHRHPVSGQAVHAAEYLAALREQCRMVAVNYADQADWTD